MSLMARTAGSECMASAREKERTVPSARGWRGAPPSPPNAGGRAKIVSVAVGDEVGVEVEREAKVCSVKRRLPPRVFVHVRNAKGFRFSPA